MGNVRGHHPDYLEASDSVGPSGGMALGSYHHPTIAGSRPGSAGSALSFAHGLPGSPSGGSRKRLPGSGGHSSLGEHEWHANSRPGSRPGSGKLPSPTRTSPSLSGVVTHGSAMPVEGIQEEDEEEEARVQAAGGQQHREEGDADYAHQHQEDVARASQLTSYASVVSAAPTLSGAVVSTSGVLNSTYALLQASVQHAELPDMPGLDLIRAANVHTANSISSNGTDGHAGQHSLSGPYPDPMGLGRPGSVGVVTGAPMTPLHSVSRHHQRSSSTAELDPWAGQSPDMLDRFREARGLMRLNEERDAEYGVMLNESKEDPLIPSLGLTRRVRASDINAGSGIESMQQRALPDAPAMPGSSAAAPRRYQKYDLDLLAKNNLTVSSAQAQVPASQDSVCDGTAGSMGMTQGLLAGSLHGSGMLGGVGVATEIGRVVQQRVPSPPPQPSKTYWCETSASK